MQESWPRFDKDMHWSAKSKIALDIFAICSVAIFSKARKVVNTNGDCRCGVCSYHDILYCRGSEVRRSWPRVSGAFSLTKGVFSKTDAEILWKWDRIYFRATPEWGTNRYGMGSGSRVSLLNGMLGQNSQRFQSLDVSDWGVLLK